MPARRQKAQGRRPNAPKSCVTCICPVHFAFFLQDRVSASLSAGGNSRADWRQPVVLVGALASDDGEEPFLQRRGHGPPASLADRDLVDRTNGGNLHRGSAEERLVSHVDEFARERLLADVESKIACECQDGV